MSSDPLIIRPARREDGESIFSWTQNTFHWGDYIQHVWYQWLTSPDGKLLVAEIDGRVVGNLHVVFLGNREGWMEGMRVHPEFRKQGIATALDLGAQSAAREARCRIVRLETSSSNLAAQSAIVTYGYRRILNLQGWESPVAHGDTTRVRRARPLEVGKLYDLWMSSWLRRAMRGLASMRSGWRFGELTRARLRDYIQAGCVWVTPAAGEPRAFAIVKLEDDDGEFNIEMPVGRGPVLATLIAQLRCVAGDLGREKMFLMFPVSRRGQAWAEAAGFSAHEHTALVYECPLV